MPASRPNTADEKGPWRYRFFAGVASLSLLADALSKAWAEVELSARGVAHPLRAWLPQFQYALAYNRGGAWGLLQDADDSLRRPFFLLISASAVAFIVSLYSRLLPHQRTVQWGLPLVLGGALGNLVDRIVRGAVVDFIDYQASWVETMNRGIAAVFSSWHVSAHWPTFNVADISICVGVGLMVLDVFIRPPAPDVSASVSLGAT